MQNTCTVWNLTLRNKLYSERCSFQLFLFHSAPFFSSEITVLFQFFIYPFLFYFWHKLTSVYSYPPNGNTFSRPYFRQSMETYPIAGSRGRPHSFLNSKVLSCAEISYTTSLFNQFPAYGQLGYFLLLLLQTMLRHARLCILLHYALFEVPQ